MDDTLTMLMLLALLFVLTYDPRSRTLERFIEGPGCCADTKYMADHHTQCENEHFESIQFGGIPGCPRRVSQVWKGAIMHT